MSQSKRGQNPGKSLKDIVAYNSGLNKLTLNNWKGVNVSFSEVYNSSYADVLSYLKWWRDTNES